jgi:bifunctional enzyme CysN/CysC
MEEVLDIEQRGPREIVRFLACGSVDDGKSTLLGRLLHDAGLVPQDQWASVLRESARLDKTAGKPDYSLLLDGLISEREQAITIDVAWRYFETGRRKYIVADTPGHEQYTRNMATGASHCQLAMLVVDARKGIQPQTRRHLTICHVMGISRLVVVINKLDLVGWSQAVFRGLEDEIAAYCRTLSIARPYFIPASALLGENVVRRGEHMPWFGGTSLFEYLESADLARAPASAELRMPVQVVARPHDEFRGLSGYVTAGSLRRGDSVRLLPSGEVSRVKRLVHFEGDRDSVAAGTSTMVVLERDLDAGRGDVLVAVDDPTMEVTDQIEAAVIWFDEAPLLAGRRYELRLGTVAVPATVRRLMHRLDLDALREEQSLSLEKNDVGHCEIALERAIPCDRYSNHRATGAFVLVDRNSGATCGAGTVLVTESKRVRWQGLDVNKAARARQKGQSPRVLWFTGLSGAGKSTIANAVEQALFSRGMHSYLLDGDNVRHGLSRDLGFSDADRVENIRRVGEVAKLMVDAGLVVLVAFISPFRADRRMVRELFESGEFTEVYVSTPLEVCERRDTKGLYKLARQGVVPNFTGVSAPYEPPLAPELELNTAELSVQQCVEQVLRTLGESSR